MSCDGRQEQADRADSPPFRFEHTLGFPRAYVTCVLGCVVLRLLHAGMLACWQFFFCPDTAASEHKRIGTLKSMSDEK